MTQGSDEWLAWRKTGIGASNMSVIMGSLPFRYESVLEMWKEKMGIIGNTFEMTAAIQEGIDTEPEAREAFTKRTGLKVKPECFTHTDYPYLRASLDGYEDLKVSKLKKMKKLPYPVTNHLDNFEPNKILRFALEVKCPQIGSYKKAAKGKILDYYYTQLQQQIAVAEVDFMYYYVYRKGEKDLLFYVPRCEPYIQELIRRGKIFAELLHKKEPALPRHFGIDMHGYSDPFKCEGMDWELLD